MFFRDAEIIQEFWDNEDKDNNNKELAKGLQGVYHLKSVVVMPIVILTSTDISSRDRLELPLGVWKGSTWNMDTGRKVKTILKIIRPKYSFYSIQFWRQKCE